MKKLIICIPILLLLGGCQTREEEAETVAKWYCWKYYSAGKFVCDVNTAIDGCSKRHYEAACYKWTKSATFDASFNLIQETWDT